MTITRSSRRSLKVRFTRPESEEVEERNSNLTRGNLDGFSSDRLFKFLNLLDQDIEIVIRPHTDPNQEAGIRVS